MPRTRKTAKTDKTTPARKRKRPVKAESPPAPESPPVLEQEEIAAMIEAVPAEVVEQATAAVKKVKVKRAPTAYNLFCKKMMAAPEVKALPNKQRFSHISKMWAAEKAK